MTADDLSRVRRFNRTVTRRLGVLDDTYLARDRPPGPSRVLWEIGHGPAAGVDVRTLRARLGLDSGYLSRVLRTLRDDGLVVMAPSGTDGRVRSVLATPAGRAELAELDRRSDEWAGTLLRRLTARQRERLVSAMAEVELLLTAAMIEIAPQDPRSPAARACLDKYFAELSVRMEDGYDPALSSTGLDALTPPDGVFLVAHSDGDPVGCGGVKLRAPGQAAGAAVIKRMWVSPTVRGSGLGRRLLAALEDEARRGGADVVQLDTHGSLTEAIALYTSAGYHPVEQNTDELYAELWFEKRLGAV